MGCIWYGTIRVLTSGEAIEDQKLRGRKCHGDLGIHDREIGCAAPLAAWVVVMAGKRAKFRQTCMGRAPAADIWGLRKQYGCMPQRPQPRMPSESGG